MTEVFFTAYSSAVVAAAMLLLCRTAYIALATPRLHPHLGQVPLVSVDMLVPARNEADRGLDRHIRLLLDQSHQIARVIVTDDRSTDLTSTILANLASLYPQKLIVVRGVDKPLDWMGKTYALQQAKHASTAKWLALVDADVECDRGLLVAAIAHAESRGLDGLCVLPQFEYRSFWIGVVLPVMIWLSAMRVSPTQTNRPSSRYAFGFGNFILVRRESHDRIGGFEAYKSSVLDDCEIFERLKASGAAVQVVEGPRLLRSPMYDSLPQLWQGFSKNSFAALRYSWLRLFAVLLCLAALPIQLLLALQSGAPLLGLVAVVLVLAAAATSGARLRAPGHYYLLFPLGFAVAAAILVRSAIAHSTTRGTSWKGRPVS